MELKYTKEDLKYLQGLSLNEKVMLSKIRITEWYNHWKGKVCVSYSGGKDSTVLLHLVRELYPDVSAVYVDTRLDFPEVREHVKNTEDVIFLKPDMNFREVVETYGFCYPSKDCAELVENARRNVNYAVKAFEGKTADGTIRPYYRDRFAIWKWLVDTDVKISAKCCYVMKEKPLDRFQRKCGFKPYIGLLAEESSRRKLIWLKSGCNAFKARRPSSKPLAFWTEQDILRYIVEENIKIPTVYGEIVADENGKFKTTGVPRTGCVFCPIGAHLHKPNKFQRMKETHPNLYKYCMNELGLDDFLTKVGVPH